MINVVYFNVMPLVLSAVSSQGRRPSSSSYYRLALLTSLVYYDLFGETRADANATLTALSPLCYHPVLSPPAFVYRGQR